MSVDPHTVVNFNTGNVVAKLLLDRGLAMERDQLEVGGLLILYVCC